MRQTKFSLTPGQMVFLARHKEFGFKDRSEVVRAALEQFEAAAVRRKLEESAALYAELYDADPDLQQLTETSLQEWPE